MAAGACAGREECLAEENVEAVVQAAEIEGVSVLDAGGAVGEELDEEPD
jgi:hypothetical protein